MANTAELKDLKKVKQLTSTISQEELLKKFAALSEITTTEKGGEVADKEESTLLSATTDTLEGKYTENGAYARTTTGHPVLDFFAQSGALRPRTDTEIINLFMPAFFYDQTQALRALFYTRNIRGGQGERRTFRVLINYLASTHPDALAPNVQFIPKYGRFDDLYSLVDTPLEDLAFAIISDQWNHDAAAIDASDFASVSLLGKWLKSENASSSDTKRLARLTYKKLNLSPREYRQSLTTFRSVINILEKAMSNNTWDTIDYEKIPSLAHFKHRAAFSRHDSARYSKYLDALQKGTKKINASTLYPYNLIEEYTNMHGGYGYFGHEANLVDRTLEAQWKALPNFLKGDDSFLVMVDTSGSMFPHAICSSVGLGIYFAEHARGSFANHFMTFTDNPRLVELPSGPDVTLLDKVRFVMNPKFCGYSTNLDAAFDALLSSAVRNSVPAADMPRAIVAISDMEIDDATREKEEKALTFTERMKKKFEEAGYNMPTLVYWNVEARQDTFHATLNDNVVFVSGQSPSIFKALCENVDGFSPVAVMERVLGEYEEIK